MQVLLKLNNNQLGNENDTIPCILQVLYFYTTLFAHSNSNDLIVVPEQKVLFVFESASSA